MPTPRRRPSPSPLAAHFPLDPEIVFLNHGSFGSCPTQVLAAQHQHQARMEREPVRFFVKDVFELIDRSRHAIASILGGAPRDYVFVPNATVGVATALAAAFDGAGLIHDRPIAPGDEILCAPVEYPACRHNLARLAERAGATVKPVALPPLDSGERITRDAMVAAYRDAVSDRTRLCLLSAVQSPTGFVMPVEQIVSTLAGLGVATVVDGAHGPGCVPTNVPAFNAPFYTANAHKWLCAPKGAAVLWARPDVQERTRPLVLSNYVMSPPGTLGRSRFNLEFDYIGTQDVSPWLAVADAVDILPRIAGMDWNGIMHANRRLALDARDLLVERLGASAPCEDAMVGPMALLLLPETDPAAAESIAARPTLYADPLQDALVERHGVQIPVWRLGDQMHAPPTARRSFRLSAQRYNTLEQYAYLAEAIAEELKREIDRTIQEQA